VAFLSDLKPTAEEQQAIATIARPWQRDKSVMGKPLTLGSRVFEKGIGVHSRSSLAFDVDEGFDVLAATIGIDAETGGKGDCVFTVLGDGRPLFTQQMKGDSPAQDISVPLGGARQLTLLVEPGADLDLADHADWCDARLIKSK
jgi:alpha-galactosidase